MEDYDFMEEPRMTLTLHGFGPLAGYLHAGDIVHRIGTGDKVFLDETAKVLSVSDVDENKTVDITLETEDGSEFTVTVPAETPVDVEPPF